MKVSRRSVRLGLGVPLAEGSKPAETYTYVMVDGSNTPFATFTDGAGGNLTVAVANRSPAAERGGPVTVSVVPDGGYNSSGAHARAQLADGRLVQVEFYNPSIASQDERLKVYAGQLPLVTTIASAPSWQTQVEERWPLRSNRSDGFHWPPTLGLKSCSSI